MAVQNPGPDAARLRRQVRLATLIQHSKCVRIAFHLLLMARKPRNFRWHWRCITREFYARRFRK